MDKKLFAAFVGTTVVTFAYTIHRIYQAERRHDALCDVLAEQNEKYQQFLTNIAFGQIAENYEE